MTDAQFYNSFSFRLFTFSRYHFTDSPGAPRHFIACMKSGTVKISAKGQTFQFSKGDVFYIPKGRKYQSSWYPDESGTVSWLSYGFDVIPTKENRRYCLQGIPLDAERKAVFDQLAESTTVSAISVGRLYTFWGLASGVMRVSPETSQYARIDEALDYMQTHNGCTMPEVAEHCGISISGLYSLFRQKLGKTPVQMRHEILISQAVELLSNTDMSVEQISAKLEFSSPSYFRKLFKTHTGVTPLELRRDRNSDS